MTTAADSAFFVIQRHRDGTIPYRELPIGYMVSMALACEIAADCAYTTRGEVYCVEDSGAIRLVLQMATVR